MFNKKFGVIALLLCIVLTLGYFAVNTGAVSTVLLAIEGAITDGNLVKFKGIHGIGEDTGLSAANVVKCKFDATIAPTANNDVDEDYTVGSRWLDTTNDKSYVCLNNADGAAVWLETGVPPSSSVTKTGDFTADRIVKINNSSGVIEQGTNTDTEVADAVTKKHAQNTDTGTTQTTFQIDSGNNGPKVRNNAGVLEARNAADNAYVDFRALSYYGDGSNLTGVGVAQATALTIGARAAENIDKGEVVYISGATGQTPDVSLADNTDIAKHIFLGVAAETQTSGQPILIRVRGELTGVNTSTFVDGDMLYLSTAGAITKVRPTSGAIEIIGYCSYAAAAGKIIIMHHSAHGIHVPSGDDIVIRMGDSAGVNKVLFKDYLNNIIGYVDSDGNIDGTSLTVDTAIAATQGGTGKATITENSFLKGGAGNTYVERTYAEVKTDLGIDLSLYYLKTEINTLAKIETIYTKDIIDSDELAAVKFTDLADTPATYDNGKYAKSTVDGVVWDDPPGGYTNLTSFVDQTAWRLFYSNNLGDVIELALGTDGQYLKSTGATSAPIFDDPAGTGDMLKATYDTDEDSDIDVAAGGTEKSAWTLYCIPYLSGTTAFGEIPIGTEGQVLKVSAGAAGYEFANESDPTVDTDAEIKAILVDEVTKTGDFTAGRMAIIDNASGIIEQGTNTDTDVADAVTKKHAQNTDTDLDATFEATFAKKADKLDVFAATTEAELYTVLSDVDEFIEAGDAIERNYYSALGSDNTYSGNADVDTITVGESVTFGDLLYHKWSDHEYYKAQADVYATARCEVIALEAKGDSETCLVLRKGYIRDDNAFDFGAVAIFLNDDTAGTCDDTAPEESGDQIQIVGTAKSADILFFNPSMDVGEVK